ncbi:MAG: cobaltochelatase subunit CobN [Candidatus Nezhaarchaeales archaeon]
MGSSLVRHCDTIFDSRRSEDCKKEERGKKIAEEYLKRFYQKNGRYPKAVGVVLWAFETMKTGGETLAAIFHLLGVKPVWRGLYIRDLEVIPLSELGRPRIDVVVTICGIFRDTFYNLVELLDRAVRIVAKSHLKAKSSSKSWTPAPTASNPPLPV